MEKLMGNRVGTLGLRGELLYAIIYGLIKFDVNARATPCHVGLLCSRKITVNGDSYAWIDREELPAITNVYHTYVDGMSMLFCLST